MRALAIATSCALCMLFAFACDKKADPPKNVGGSAAVPVNTTIARGIGPRSCQNADLCLEWQRLDPDELLSAKQDCNDSEGKFTNTLCAKDRAVASCAHESGGAVVYLYPTPALDLGAAENECKKTQGTFLRLMTKAAIGSVTDGGH